MRPAPPLLCAALAVLLHAPRAEATEDRAARIELMTTSTLYGAGLGVYSSLKLDLRPRPAAWIAAGLGGGMLYGSYTLGERWQLTTPNVRYLETAGGWTGVDAMLLALALDTEDGAAGFVGFGGAALGAGTALATLGRVHASEGQLSLVNTGGLFMPVAGVLTGLTLHLGDGSHLARDLLILNVAGLGLGAGLTAKYDPTREQVLYLDGGMLVGGLCGGLVGTMGAVVTDTWEVISGMAVAGMGVGGWLAVRSQGFDRRGKRPARTGTTEAQAEGATRAAPAFFVPLAAGRF